VRRSPLLILALIWAARPPVAIAQDDSLVQSFVEQARLAAGRLPDLATAIAAGYRAVGPELPAMGQHWVNPALLYGGRIDPARPQVLEYATFDGHPTLVGVAYALLLGPGEAPPDDPVPGRLWHAHGGDLNEESLSDSHAGSGDPDRDRVAVLHVWVPRPNPAGTFTAENWTLPFLRSGLIAPPDAPDASARALALGTGALSHVLAQYRAHVNPDSSDSARVAAMFRDVADSVARWRTRHGDNPVLAPAEVTWLAALWQTLEASLPHRMRAGLFH
jgi:hypothetical protein